MTNAHSFPYCTTFSGFAASNPSGGFATAADANGFPLALPRATRLALPEGVFSSSSFSSRRPSRNETGDNVLSIVEEALAIVNDDRHHGQGLPAEAAAGAVAIASRQGRMAARSQRRARQSRLCDFSTHHNTSNDNKDSPAGSSPPTN